MQLAAQQSTGRALAVLIPVFALTGIIHAIGGPLLPSLVSTFHLNDNQSGQLFFLYFSGSSLGALLCRGNYARAMAAGLAAVVVCCLFAASASWPVLALAFFLLGVSVGVPMSAVSLYVGRAFPERCAPQLTFLNFIWSVGALLAPLLAARILIHHSYRAAYLLLASGSAVAALACAVMLRDPPAPIHPQSLSGRSANLRTIFVFALAAFLQVGVENTTAAWLTTYSLRTNEAGVVLAAASTSLYWGGFVISRGAASLLLLRLHPALLFRAAVAIALVSGILLAAASVAAFRTIAMFVLGVALAPVFPLVIAGFFARTRHTSDSRWVLAAAGFGGSVLPWLAGWISAHTGTVRAGILVVPTALLLMMVTLPALGESETHDA
jgi:fucose permease